PQYPQYAYAPLPQYAPPPYQPAPQPYQAQPSATPTATPAAMPAMPAPYGYQPSAPPPRDNLQLSSQPLVTPRSHLHDAEVIGDLAAVGALASIDLCVRQNITDGNAVTFILLAGLAGGGGAGYLLANKYPIDAGAAHSTTIGLMLGAANGALLI